MTREHKITLIGTIIIVGFILSILYHYAAGVYQNLGYPFNTFLFRPIDRFMDFVVPYTISADPYGIARSDYQNFPALYKIASAFALLPLPIALILFILLFISGFFLLCRWQVRNADRFASLQNTLIYTFFSYPFLFALDRGNLEILVFFCLYSFVFLYHKKAVLSAVFLGIAIALKAFPVVIAILLLADRRFKEILVAAVTALGLTLLSYLTLPGGVMINITNHLRNLDLYNTDYAIGAEGLHFGNSLFGAIKYVLLPFRPEWIEEGVPPDLVTGYMIFIMLILLLLAGYIVFYEKEFWKRVTLLICSLNLLPFASGDYKLLYIFIPVFLFVNEAKTDQHDWLIAGLLGLLLIPKDYAHLSVLPEVSVAILLNPLLMIALMASLIIMRRRISDQNRPEPGG